MNILNGGIHMHDRIRDLIRLMYRFCRRPKRASVNELVFDYNATNRAMQYMYWAGYIDGREQRLGYGPPALPPARSTIESPKWAVTYQARNRKLRRWRADNYEKLEKQLCMNSTDSPDKSSQSS